MATEETNIISNDDFLKEIFGEIKSEEPKSEEPKSDIDKILDGDATKTPEEKIEDKTEDKKDLSEDDIEKEDHYSYRKWNLG